MLEHNSFIIVIRGGPLKSGLGWVIFWELICLACSQVEYIVGMWSSFCIVLFEIFCIV